MKIQSDTWLWVGKVVLLVAAIAGAIWTWRSLAELRVAVYEKREQLEEQPTEAARYASVRAEINKRQPDIDRVKSFLVSRDTVGEIVAEIESTGAAYRIEVSVPQVEEKQLLDDNGNPVEATGPLYDVGLKVVATGKPKDLLAFLHSIENMQRLVYLNSWRLDASEKAAQNQQALSPLDRRVEVRQRPGLLTAELIIAVLKE